MSAIGKVAFLKFFLHGGDPDALFQEEAIEQRNRLASRTEQLVQNRVDRRHALATEAKAVTDQLAEIPQLEEELKVLQLANEKVEALIVLQHGLKDRVQAGQQMVQHNQQIVTILQKQLKELQQICTVTRSQPSYYELRIGQLQQRVSRMIGEP